MNQHSSLDAKLMAFQKDIEYLKDGQGKNDEQHEQILKKIEESSVKIDNFIQSAKDRYADKKDHIELTNQIADLDDKFAPRMAWTILCWAGGIIGTAVIIGVIGLIAETFLHVSTKI